MIKSVKEIYSNYLILTKKRKYIYDLKNKKIDLYNINQKYVLIIDKNTYEVYNKRR